LMITIGPAYPSLKPVYPSAAVLRSGEPPPMPKILQ
jgi:hypothetical protein